MRNFNLILLLLASFQLSAQEYQLLYQDGGAVLVHPNCQVLVANPEDAGMGFYSSQVEKALRLKGYEAKFLTTTSWFADGSQKVTELKENSLLWSIFGHYDDSERSWMGEAQLFDILVSQKMSTQLDSQLLAPISHPMMVKEGKRSKRKGPFHLSRNFKRMEQVMVDLTHQLPSCSEESKLSDDNTQRQQELLACGKNYQIQLESFQSLPSDGKQKVRVGAAFALAGAGVIAFPPAIIPAAFLVINQGSNLRLPFTRSIKLDQLRDSLTLVKYLIDVELEGAPHYSLEELAPSTQRLLDKLVRRTGSLKTLSTLVGDYLADNQLCSKLSEPMDQKSFKKILKDARSSF